MGLGIPESLPIVEVDAELLKRGVANAVKYGPSDIPVLLRTTTLGARVEACVVDRGPEPPDANQDRIFEPFQCYSDAPGGVGVGLGLAVTRGFTEARGGPLVAADTPGGGLTMVLDLLAALRCPEISAELPSEILTCRRRRADQRVSPRCRLATAGETALKGR